jgi:multiple sugar transport system permease protein
MTIVRRGVRGWAISLVAIVTALIFLFPFFWMVTTSLKPEDHVYVVPPEWIPRSVDFSNFGNILSVFPFFKYAKNTLIACVLSAFGQTLCSALAAYAFSRLKWKGRNAFFIVTLSTMIIPPSVFAIPWYILYWRLGLLGSLAPLWLPYWFQHPYIIFLLTQFFRTIPESISDAARIDGNNEFMLFWRIIVPLSRPSLVTAFLLHFIFMWKNLMIPLMYINDEELFTLSVGLQALLGGTVKPPFNEVMAAATMASLPLVIIFILLRKSIFSGIAATSLK